MGKTTKIPWTDASWNPVSGCSHVSDGCRNCYAERLALRYGWSKKPWTAENASENVRLKEKSLRLPFHWFRPRKVFVNSTSDLFHEQIPFEFIDRVFAVMALCPQHTFQILTKRPKRMLEYFKSRENGYVDGADDAVWEFVDRIQDGDGLLPHLREAGWMFETYRDEEDLNDSELEYHGELPFPNIWLGVSVENQRAADERIPLLLDTPAAVRFVSCEPLLEKVDLSKYLTCEWYAGELIYPSKGTIGGVPMPAARLHPALSWVIVGGESGLHHRAMELDWARSLRDQCVSAGAAFFFKQESAIRPSTNPTLDGVTWHEFPVSANR